RAVDANGRWRGQAEPNSALPDLHNLDVDVAINHDAFAQLPTDNQHGNSSFRTLATTSVSERKNLRMIPPGKTPLSCWFGTWSSCQINPYAKNRKGGHKSGSRLNSV